MNKKLSSLTERFFDQYLISEYPDFVQFFKEVFKYLEEHNNVFDLILNYISRFGDIDNLKNSTDEIDLIIKDLLIKQFISQFPLYRIEDIDTIKLIKNAKDFYSIKGTERSYRYMFYLLNHIGAFDFYYPYRDIFLLSDSINGVLNDNKYIHDNNYYAYFVYEIRSTIYGYFELKDIIDNVLHPVGNQIFFLRIVQDTNEDIDLEEDVFFNLFSFQDEVIAYLIDEDIYLDEIDYEDVETVNDTYLLSYFDIEDLEEIFYEFENEDDDFFRYQMSFQMSLL